MIDAASRSEPRSCRTPDDDDDRHSSAAPTAGGQSEKPRLTCSLDVDWNEDNASHAAPTVSGPPAPPAAPPKQATNNATRTSERSLDAGAYGAAGHSDESDAFYAGVAALKGRDASGEVEILSASVQVGAQNEAQATGVRVATSNAHGSISVEGGTANAHAGFSNPDGSTGINGGAQASAVYVEGTLSGAANSLTAGVGFGSGAEGSIGVRDKDHDGNPEVCFRVAASFGMVGACIEIPFHGKM